MPQHSTLLRSAIIIILIASLLLVVAATVGIGAIFMGSGSPSSGSQEMLRIGVVQYAPVSNILTQGFKQGMEELGYVEGVHVEYVETAPTLDNALLSQNARDIASQNVDIIFATTAVGGLAALNATADIPIVWTHAAGAVANGLAANYNSSGNNSTGIEISFAELTRKKMEFLNRIDPTIETIGLLEPAARDFATLSTLPIVIEEAPKYNITLAKYPVASTVDTQALAEVAQIMADIQAGAFDAYVYIPSPSVAGQSLETQIAMTKRLQVPSFWLTQDEVLKGGLFTYEYDNIAMGRQSAGQAHKILQGTAPLAIPIEFPAKISLIMNLKTAQEIGLDIPEDILQIVDIAIE